MTEIMVSSIIQKHIHFIQHYCKITHLPLSNGFLWHKEGIRIQIPLPVEGLLL